MSYSLTLHFFPSPRGVHWESPYALAKSVLINTLTFGPRQIGHVSVQLEGPSDNIHAGMRAVDMNDNRKLILLKHLGFGTFFMGTPGFLEDRSLLEPEIERRQKNGHFSFLRFEISEASFLKTRQYLVEFREKTGNKVYGFPFRPRHAEGGGCSAFAASVLEVAGLMNDEFKKNWSDRVRVPEFLIGSLEPPRRRVWLSQVLLPIRRNKRWAAPQEPGRDIEFWDPDMMHAWVLKRWQDLQHFPIENETAVQEKNAKGILVQASKIVPTNEPIWLA